MLAVVNGSGLVVSIGMVLFAMYIIKYACDSFEGACDYLGREVYHMQPGIRGATLEAIASSLPELFTTLFLLFIFDDVGGFAAGVATCAGSAVFNAVIIPAVCILAVTLKGVNGQKVERLELKLSTIVRDGSFFILAELCLIYFLGTGALMWWMGITLMLLYGVYFAILMRGIGSVEEGDSEEDDEDNDEDARGFIGSLLTFDFHQLIYKGREFTAGSAWVVLICATATIAAACYLLSESVILSAESLHVKPYFTAVIFGAATSVPDTFLSYKDAMKVDYDDAVANAIGSNIFDICVALGFPLALYSGLEVLQGGAGIIVLENNGPGGVQDLRIALMILSVVIVGMFVAAPKKKEEEGTLLLIGNGHGFGLIGLYVVWTAFVVYQVMN
ncbi:MAG: pseudouridine synthase [Deltaproteobacteria bacterium]|nr:pseudouridine synthase [Deltaproteobacteria bacterium]